MADTLQVGLLSCGGMARTLGRALGKVPRAQLAQVCDLDGAAARAFGEEMGVPWTTDAQALLADDRIAAVIIATPNFTHVDLVEVAAKAGKHIFCEKPLALSTADADRMLAATRAAGVHLVVGHVLRLLPVFDHIRTLVADGVLGRPFALRITRAGGWGERQPWRQQRRTSGGPLFEVNVHELDFMRCLLGEPQSVYAMGANAVVSGVDFEDTAMVSVRFAEGAFGALHCSIGAALPEYTGTLQGTEGTLRFSNGGPRRIDWKRFDGTAGELSGDALAVPDAHVRELGFLVAAALDGVTPQLRGEDGRAAVAMAEAAVRSMQSGKIEPVAPPA